jgi:outer membrane protein, heavy metal efflux system
MRTYCWAIIQPLSIFLSGILLIMPVTLHSQPNIANEPSAFELPSPMSLADAVQAARSGRAEITAANARAAAARERGAIVSALEDPMLMTSVDHYPWSDMNSGRSVDPMTSGLDPMFNQQTGRRLDWSIAVEQRFPLSPVRSHQRRGAGAEARRLSADSERVALDVELQAAEAFLMLYENRQMLEVLAGQLALAKQMIEAANARSATTSGAQVDLLRAEVEAARLQAQQRSLFAEERGAQAMLNMSMGRQVDAPIPALASPANIVVPQASIIMVEQALAQRPELQSGQAEIDKADAEVDVMRSMYRPMAVVRLGVASTMAEGSGGMAMLGVSVPLWRSKLRAGVSEAQAMESMARADLVAMQQMVRAEVLVARENVIAARETYIALRDEVVPRAQIAVRPALASFSSGTGALTTVIEAIRTQWAVEAELVMAETNLALSWVRLNRVSGNPPGLTLEQSQ